MSWKLSLPICVLILALAGAAIWLIFATEPTAERIEATKRTAMLVEVTGVEHGDFQPHFDLLGVVRPAREVELSSRVSGYVLRRHADFVPGAVVEADTVLVELDPVDYRRSLTMRETELARAEAERALEAGLGAVAEADFAAFEGEVSAERAELALREPQRRIAEAAVAAAAAERDLAADALARTEIRAPFAAMVLARMTEKGDQLAAGQGVAELVGVEAYWVEVTVPQHLLGWIELPTADEPGAEVRIQHRSAWPVDVHRSGHIERLLGALTPETRLARLLVRIPDPLARSPEHAGQPRLILGTVVAATVPGRPLEGVVRVPRELVRTGDTVWTMVDGTLAIAEVEVAVSDARYAYVSAGLAPDAQIVTTNLATVTEGAPLRLEGEPDPEAAEADADGADDASDADDDGPEA